MCFAMTGATDQGRVHHSQRRSLNAAGGQTWQITQGLGLCMTSEALWQSDVESFISTGSRPIADPVIICPNLELPRNGKCFGKCLSKVLIYPRLPAVTDVVCFSVYKALRQFTLLTGLPLFPIFRESYLQTLVNSNSPETHKFLESTKKPPKCLETIFSACCFASAR